MKLRKCQSTVPEACSEQVQQTTKRRISRRQFVQTGVGVAAAGALLGRRAFAAPRPIKIGYVSPATGPIAIFGQVDAYVIDRVRKRFLDGLQVGGVTRSVEIVLRDSQSSPNRAAQVASEMIKSDKIDMMLVAGTPDTVNPVADQCEINKVPCVSSDDPWNAFYFGRGGTPDKGFDWTYNFFWGSEIIANVQAEMCNHVKTNKVWGCLWGNDTDGMIFSDPVHGCPPLFEKWGYKVVDPGRFSLDSNDFTAQITAFKKANAECLYAVVPLSTFSTFWTQCAQQGWWPKICIPGKVCEFPLSVQALGPLGKYVATEIWWARNAPFKSSLTGQTGFQYCDEYEDITGKQWTQALGFRHALFEVGADVLMRAKDAESADSIIAAVRSTRLKTLVGPIQWEGPPPDKWTQIPVKNCCTTPMVGGQWVPGKKWPLELVVTTNWGYPPTPVEATMVPLPPVAKA